MNIRIPTRVVKLEERTRVLRARKIGDDVDYERESMGWFVHFEGSYESLFVGHERPDNLDPGTEVDILIVPRKHGAVK